VNQQFSEEQVRQALGVAHVEYLGTGSFGETWRAAFDGRSAAYKIIHRPGYSTDRLEREIEGYRRVASEHVVFLHDARTIEVAGSGRAVMIFEFVDGGDLTDAIATGQPSGAQLRGLARGLLTGVLAMHTANLLHRDLKPANVALRDGAYESPVILDLGLAKLLDVESITRYPAGIGTPLYMAPEQLRGERALRGSDLWAAGVVLFEAATGQHPFLRAGESISLAEALARLASPPSVPEAVPPDVGDLIRRCLSDPPYRRGTVAKALTRLT
jgi:eukaryotic-like serine/threonine-protein kinase